jgi:hypothetical protein
VTLSLEVFFMGRYFRSKDDGEPRFGPSNKARLAVIGFIGIGIWLLRSVLTGEDARIDGPTVDVQRSFGASLPGRVATGSAQENPGERVLSAMLDTYQNLPAFREQSRIQIEIDRPGPGAIRETIDLRLSYEAPNRLRFVVLRPHDEITVACNGTELRARIVDAASRNFDDQFVQRPAPRQVDVTTVFSATEFADPARPHELLSALLGIPIDMTVTSLGMLTDHRALQEMFQQATEIARLADQQIQGVDCAVVRVTGRQGNYTFWVDQGTNLVRRIDHPVTRIVGGADSQRPGSPATAPQARLVSEHAGERDPLFVAQEFELAAPSDAKLVRHFVSPPPDPDIALLNARVPPFSFTDLNGDVFASGQWAGRLALLIWFNDHPACRQLLTNLATVFEKYRENERVFCCAISTDPATTMGHQDVRNLAASWGVPIPVVRDLEAVGREVFAVQQAPTLIVTSPDPSGGVRIQLVEVGSQADLAEQLPMVIDQLLDGQNVAENYIHFVERRQREYQQYLAAASVVAPTSVVELPTTEVATASEFSRLALSPLWQIRDLRSPGNILVDHSSGQPMLLIHDGWHEVVQIDAAGRLRSHHPLDQDTEVSRLRALITPRSETLFVGHALNGKRIAVFDSNWRQLLRYPSSGEEFSGVQDALLTELDADGKLELYVGFAGTDGVHRVDLNGKRVWSNRQLNSVLSLTAVTSDSGRQLLVTSNDGSLVPIDANGHLGQPFSIGSRVIHHLSAGPVREDQPPWYCGLSYNVHGNLFVLGLDDQLREKWNYLLPPGSMDSQVQVGRVGQVVPGADWQWLFAGPDGSVHVISPDGQFFDRFNTGAPIHGLAGFRSGEVHTLVVASDQAVAAYQVDLR